MSRAIKVAFLSHYADMYGANRSLLCLLDNLSRHNIQPFVILPEEGKMVCELRKRNIQFTCIPIELWIHQPVHSDKLPEKLYQYLRQTAHVAKKLFANLAIQPRLVHQLRTWNIDLVYTNSAVIPSGALAASLLRKPHIWHLREFIDLDYGFQHDFGKPLHDAIIRSASANIAISEAIAKHFSSNLISHKLHQIYNGATSGSEFLHLRELASRPREATQPYTFALVGLIHEAKGQQEAIQALSILHTHYSEARLLIVGSGSTHAIDSLKQRAAALGVLEKVDFWGYVDDPYKAYLAADAVLMCSKNEGMGRVTVEAMAACRPVIAYDNAGSSEIIQHGINGLLYQQGADDLARCMAQLIESPLLARAMGQRAWELAKDKYSTETYSAQIAAVIQSVLKT